MLLVEPVPLIAAFSAGILSFLSPCILPLIPAYFSFISGVSMDELGKGPSPGAQRRIRLTTLGFIAGFSLVFIALGASATFLGQLLSQNGGWVRMVGGSLVLVFGLHLMGLLRIPFLQTEKRVHLKTRPVHGLAAFFIGMAFAAGWSPCIGPLLGSILVMAGTRESLEQGILLLSVYALGLALPFALLAFTAARLMAFVRKAKPFLRAANITAGILLVTSGLLLMTNQMGRLMFLP
ncbi:cytochrome c biogenesis CcdA family protein [Desulfobotulus sp.]|jgi:cytochrome c-type biogenesis protein|uniref:cytochrome c biogenesis CcdA family protein n=1 Tax=Desulfobotulus sp. TaxID=1940337 RepID=UPI002A367DC6|nr:cytochrome c biogenesis protein CcdA [Desulfobotulus sp.]MDY0162589.1 cytochrome c biogenesis protein CcdA [Desulfobotulus sp.]